ncbi:asparagine synthase (glutamine-hydrolyzing) [Terasakiella pusilla]|uniref:asparagine synthase (glutamine-hydrolyzing) n=1 Tax=Terasakiella pusilla TaxID=64973 RepID=UPI0004906DC0|nr:asparagine synthase (glutamine-hydrolyzing) [Terasakiella pusilla]
MCGIVGLWDAKQGVSEQDLKSFVDQMSDQIVARGPDAGGAWVDGEQGVALGHRRLSIIDLTEAGSQPMTSSCGRYVIVYNGEIYNSKELREDISFHKRSYRGYSDTETIVESCATIGVRKTVEKLIGMFAFALWDKQEKSLCLVRDRLGIKPLYWADYNGTLLFASELKSIVKHPSFVKEVNYDAVASYLRHSYVPAPYSIYQNVYKMLPGEVLTRRVDGVITKEKFWSMQDVYRQGKDSPFQGSAKEAVDALDSLLRDSVKRRMVADVPLGAFLSGGIDSSLVAGAMQAQSSQKIKTFSIGFSESDFNEAPHARAVAEHLGTDHTELYVMPEMAQEVIPQLPVMFDEPFADSSQIPTYLVSAMTRKHVTVALSGDGGDELFCGYSRYLMAGHMGEKISALPPFLRKVGAGVIKSVPPQAWNQMAKVVPEGRRPKHIGSKLYKLAAVLDGRKDDLFRSFLSHWDADELADLIVKGREIETLLQDETLNQQVPNFYERMQYIDTLMYLPDDILTKVDRASMAVSLEARVPLLDHRVVEFAWSLPHEMKVHQGKAKWILKQTLQRYVPAEITERPKMGFGVPVGEWIKGPLREWAEALLSEQKLLQHNLVQVEAVRQRWHEHQLGTHNWQAGLWNVLMLQSWADEWL